MPVRQYANAPATTLANSCTALATSIVVTSTTGLPIAYPYTLILDRGTATEEAVSVTAAAGTTLTVTRGIDSTTAFAHSAGASVVHGITAQDIREANAHVNATTGVHGTTGALVGTSDTQTLTNKTISVDSNTVSGVAASSFVLSNISGNIDGTAAQKAVPSGAVVGTTDTQTLTNKTLTAPAATGSLAGFGGARTIWTPTITASSGTFTGVSASGRYIQRGKDVHWSLTISITNAGTATGYIEVPLPVTAVSSAGAIGTGRVLEGAPSKVVQVFLSTASVARVSRYDDNTAIGTGYTLHLFGTYEAA